jgi:hypothetical protein
VAVGRNSQQFLTATYGDVMPQYAVLAREYFQIIPSDVSVP